MAFLYWHVFVGLDTEGMVALWESAVTLFLCHFGHYLAGHLVGRTVYICYQVMVEITVMRTCDTGS